MAVAHGDVPGILRQHGYKEVKRIGEGSFGQAILVQADDGARLVCKLVDVSRASSKETASAKMEGQLLAELKHPYIVRYRENFADNGWLCILMDFCEGGDLTKQIDIAKRKQKPIVEDQILRWFTQAIVALKYIHDRHILHRDLKPSNFFLSKTGNLKMGDFGIAKVLACTLAVAKTQIGTPYYLSPELCQGNSYTWPSDIWAMGCILYELTALRVPFDASSFLALVQRIVEGVVPSVSSTYSGFVRCLCSEMLNRSPEARPSSDAILQRMPIQAVVKKLLEEAQVPAHTEAFNVASVPRPLKSATPSPPPAAAQVSGPYESTAGTYSKGDTIEYLSNAFKDWLPATVIKTDGEGRITMDLKPNTWLTKADQATRVRPMTRRSSEDRAAAAGVAGQSPSLGAAIGAAPQLGVSPCVEATPRLDASPRVVSASPILRQRERSLGTPMQRQASRGASPAERRSPSAGGLSTSRGQSPFTPMPQRSPPFGMRERGASPARERSPSESSAGLAGGEEVAARASGPYGKGDLVEYFSSSHKAWLPATVINTDSDGRIVIDLKPNTWMSNEDQAGKIRRRRSVAAAQRPGGAGLRGESLGGGSPRAATPGRASPRALARGSSREPPLVRAESPYIARRSSIVDAAGAGTPRMRPPALPPGMPPGAAFSNVPPRAYDSPLRQGGRNIAGPY